MEIPPCLGSQIKWQWMTNLENCYFYLIILIIDFYCSIFFPFIVNFFPLWASLERQYQISDRKWKKLKHYWDLKSYFNHIYHIYQIFNSWLYKRWSSSTKRNAGEDIKWRIVDTERKFSENNIKWFVTQIMQSTEHKQLPADLQLICSEVYRI